MLVQDLYIAIKHLPTLPFVLGTVPNIIDNNGELNISSYKSPLQSLYCLKNVFFGTHKTVNIEEPVDNETIVYFLNGICTDEVLWEINAKQLESIFNFKVYPLYNRTNGIVIDLKDCILGRTFDINDAESRKLYSKLKNALSIRKKVIVIAHSQGGIIISQLVDQLLFDKDPNINKLEVYTFASASDTMSHGKYYCEHFANSMDYVARIGVLEYRTKFYGKLFKFNHSGHLLNTHYLKHFKKGFYCGGKSRLSTYLKNEHINYIKKEMR